MDIKPPVIVPRVPEWSPYDAYSPPRTAPVVVPVRIDGKPLDENQDQDTQRRR